MDVVSLELAKLHLRVSGNSEDVLIKHYIEGATSYILNYTNRKTLPGSDESPANIPKDIQDAALLLVADSYENREAKILGTIVAENPAAHAKLHFYRINIGI